MCIDVLFTCTILQTCNSGKLICSCSPILPNNVFHSCLKLTPWSDARVTDWRKLFYSWKKLSFSLPGRQEAYCNCFWLHFLPFNGHVPGAYPLLINISHLFMCQLRITYSSWRIMTTLHVFCHNFISLFIMPLKCLKVLCSPLRWM